MTDLTVKTTPRQRLYAAAQRYRTTNGAERDAARQERQAALHEIVAEHARWVRREIGSARANLADAYLAGADLAGANLAPIWEDVDFILSAARAEAPALLSALREGRINGSAYEGPCACLIGTLANARGCIYTQLEGVTPNPKRPAERWFAAIRRGDTPATNPVSALTVEHVEQWLAAHGEVS